MYSVDGIAVIDPASKSMAAGQNTPRDNLFEYRSMMLVVVVVIMMVAAMVAVIPMPPIATVATTDRDNASGRGQ